MKLPLIAIALSLCSQFSPVWAQDPVLLPARLELWEAAPTSPPQPGRARWSSEVLGRFSKIGGDDGAGGTWDDNFEDGLGLRVSSAYQQDLDDRWALGGYIAGGFDLFEGKSSGGVSLDDWLITSIHLGPAATLYLGEDFFLEGYAGIGFVGYNAVDASGFGASVQVFERSIALAWELGVRGGYSFGRFSADRRENAPEFGIVAGVGFNWRDAPDVDSDFSAAVGGLSADPVENVVLDIGVWIGF